MIKKTNKINVYQAASNVNEAELGPELEQEANEANNSGEREPSVTSKSLSRSNSHSNSQSMSMSQSQSYSRSMSEWSVSESGYAEHTNSRETKILTLLGLYRSKHDIFHDAITLHFSFAKYGSKFKLASVTVATVAYQLFCLEFLWFEHTMRTFDTILFLTLSMFCTMALFAMAFVASFSWNARLLFALSNLFGVPSYFAAAYVSLLPAWQVWILSVITMTLMGTAFTASLLPTKKHKKAIKLWMHGHRTESIEIKICRKYTLFKYKWDYHKVLSIKQASYIVAFGISYSRMFTQYVAAIHMLKHGYLVFACLNLASAMLSTPSAIIDAAFTLHSEKLNKIPSIMQTVAGTMGFILGITEYFMIHAEPLYIIASVYGFFSIVFSTKKLKYIYQNRTMVHHDDDEDDEHEHDHQHDHQHDAHQHIVDYPPNNKSDP